MNDFLSKKFYGNDISQWLIALSIILATVILGRVLYWFFTKIVRIFTDRTKTKLDDIIIDKIEEPIIAVFVIVGAWYGISTLDMSKSVANQISGGVVLIIVLDIAWLIVRTVDGLIEEYIVPLVEKSENNLDDAILPIARRGFEIMVWVIAVVIGLNNAGYDVAAILSALGIGGLALALGARTTLMNVFGGLVILINQPFKIEDRIRIDEHDGYVEKITLSNTKLRTFLDNYLVTIPNRLFTDKEVVNISAAPGSKADFSLHLPINTSSRDIRGVVDFLKDLSLTHPEVSRDCRVAMKGVNDYSLVILFIFYIYPDAPYWDVKTEVILSILDELKYRGINMVTRNSLTFVPDVSETENAKKLKEQSKKKYDYVAEDDEDDFV